MIGRHQRDIDWDPVSQEMRQYRVLRHADDAMSGEEYFRECPGGLCRFVKLNKKRRKKYGYDETDPMNAYNLSSGEKAEEEETEVDEVLPPVAAASAMMGHAELYGASSVHANDGPGAAAGAASARSGSNTREYLDSLPGSPHSENDATDLPTIGVDWNDFDVIFQHLPVSHRERAKRVQEVGLFNHQILKEYLQTHLMSIFPGRPDMMWDYGAWRTQGERRNFDVFLDIVVHGMYQQNWGPFVEQWFVHEEYEANRPSDIPWNSD